MISHKHLGYWQLKNKHALFITCWSYSLQIRSVVLSIYFSFLLCLSNLAHSAQVDILEEHELFEMHLYHPNSVPLALILSHAHFRLSLPKGSGIHFQ